MSQYVSVFAKKNDVFVCLGEFLSSTEIAKALSNFAPWEKLHVLTIENLREALELIEVERANTEDILAYNERVRAAILAANGDLDERIERWHSYESSNEECAETLRELDAAQNFIWTLRGIMDDNRSWDNSKKEWIPLVEVCVGTEANEDSPFEDQENRS